MSDVRAAVADDAFLKVAFHDGVEIQKIKHFGRHIRAELRTALELGPPPGFDGKRCACGCGKRHKIQNDHIDPVANGGPTCFANLQGLVPKEHVEKTRRDRAAGLLGPIRRRLDGETEDADGPDPPREAGVEGPCRSVNDLRREDVKAVQAGPGPVQLTRASTLPIGTS